MKLKYKLVDVRSNDRHPGYIYATIVDENDRLCVNAELSYCAQWLEEAALDAMAQEEAEKKDA